MEALSTDKSDAGKVIVITTGTGVVIATGPGAVITSGAGAVNATGAAAVHTAGAGAVNTTGVLAAQGTAKYESSSPSAGDTFFGWTLVRCASGGVPRPTSNSKTISVLTSLVVDVGVRISLKKKRRAGIGRKFVRGLVGTLAKCIVSCTRGTSKSASG